MLVETAKTRMTEGPVNVPVVPASPNTEWHTASWDAKTGATTEVSGKNGPSVGGSVSAQDYDSPPPIPPATYGPGLKITTGYMSARTEDPPNLDVNKIEQWLTWIWDGANAIEDSGTIHWESYFLTGWSRYSHSDSHGTYGYQYTYQQTYTTFKNTFFCNPTADTWVHYSPMTIYGYASGYLAGEVWRTKSGDCEGLLDFPDVTLQRNSQGYY